MIKFICKQPLKRKLFCEQEYKTTTKEFESTVVGLYSAICYCIDEIQIDNTIEFTIQEIDDTDGYEKTIYLLDVIRRYGTAYYREGYNQALKETEYLRNQEKFNEKVKEYASAYIKEVFKKYAEIKDLTNQNSVV